MRALTTRWPGASDCERLTSKGPSARGVCNLLHNSTTYSGVGLAVRPSGRPGPDRHAEDHRSLPIRSGFEADQEDHLALLLGNSREGAIEIAQREPPCRIGCCYRGWPIIVNLARGAGAFSHIAPDTVYVQVMHKREEAGAEIGTALPAMLLCNRTDEGVLDQIVGPGHVVGQSTSIAPRRGIPFSRSRPKSFILPSNVLGKLPAGYGA
jgi:hypothetical protein